MTNAQTNVDRCAVCGGNLALIGRVHRCVPRAVITAAISPEPTPETVRGAQQFQAAAVEAVRRELKPKYPGRKSADEWRAYMRDHMRKRRAKKG